MQLIVQYWQVKSRNRIILIKNKRWILLLKTIIDIFDDNIGGPTD